MVFLHRFIIFYILYSTYLPGLKVKSGKTYLYGKIIEESCFPTQ